MSNKSDWEKQIENMQPNESDIIKAKQKKQGRESRRENIKKKDEEYARKKWWDEMDKPTQEQYIKDHPKSREGRLRKKGKI